MTLSIDVVDQCVHFIGNRIQNDQTRYRCKSGLYAVACAVYGVVSFHLMVNMSHSPHPHITRISYSLAFAATGAMIAKYALLSEVFYKKSVTIPAPVHHQVNVVQHDTNA